MAIESENPCIDEGSPFNSNLYHIGQFNEGKSPRNHCIVGTAAGLALLRFTPHECPEEYEEHPAFEITTKDLRFPEVTDVAAAHLRHLRKLADIGIQTTFRDLETGTCPGLDNVVGTFVLQGLLPVGSKPADSQQPGFDVIISKLLIYADWAAQTEDSNSLEIANPNQFSRLPDQSFVLHDIEPSFGLTSVMKDTLLRYRQQQDLEAPSSDVA